MKSRKDKKEMKYKGITYLIKQNPRMGFYLAYIKLPTESKLTKKDYDDIDLDVHGGLTFKETFTGKETPEDNWWGFTKGTWIGWDYGHAGDFIYGDFDFGLGEKRWEYKEVESEIKQAIKQLLKT